jgi:hypothetical protein
MKEEKKEMMNELGWRKDKYDFAIEYLHENPDDIGDAWGSPQEYAGKGGELFGFVGPDWTSNSQNVRYEGSVGGTCGCLQQIRKAKEDGNDGTYGEMCMSHWPRLWEQIASDRRLPFDQSDIGLEELPVFAEWQRKVDLMRIADGIEVDPIGAYA